MEPNSLDVVFPRLCPPLPVHMSCSWATISQDSKLQHSAVHNRICVAIVPTTKRRIRHGTMLPMLAFTIDSIFVIGGYDGFNDFPIKHDVKL